MLPPEVGPDDEDEAAGAAADGEGVVRTGPVAAYGAVRLLREDGWRDLQGSRVGAAYGDLGWRSGRSEAHLKLRGGASVLDGPAKAVAKQVRSTFTGPAKDLLSGTWLGHALHPVLTDVVVGSFTSATLLDLLAGEDADVASERLIIPA